MKAKYGYCGMTGDFIHIGHINFLEKCKEHCDKLIVGVMDDDIVEKYKGQKPIMNVYEREKIIRNIKYVGGTFIQDTYEFPHHIFRLKEFHGENFIIFDSEEHKREGATVIIPRTKGISSSSYKRMNNENINNSQR